MEKKFLIIHPTADGRTVLLFLDFTFEPDKDERFLTFPASCVSPEKVHFQHTAKFIAQLISERANYTLQVSETFTSYCNRG